MPLLIEARGIYNIRKKKTGYIQVSHIGHSREIRNLNNPSRKLTEQQTNKTALWRSSGEGTALVTRGEGVGAVGVLGVKFGVVFHSQSEKRKNQNRYFV